MQICVRSSFGVFFVGWLQNCVGSSCGNLLGEVLFLIPVFCVKKIKLRRLLNQQNLFDFLVLFLLPFFV